MTTTPLDFNAPAPLAVADGPIIDRNGVRRSKDGRPYIKSPCPEKCDAGRVPGARAGTTKKCPKGCTEGVKESLYTRCTSFVGALEDRQNLEAWQKRIVLLGLKARPPLYERLGVIEVDDREMLDVLAEEAYEAGDGYRAAQKGTDLHEMTEHVDRGEPLPDDVTLEDRLDLGAYVREMAAFGVRVLDLETFVVHDRLRIAGTYDRRIESDDPRLACPVGCGKPRILDLKTGRVDYGAGKMAQQLAVYANSRAYDPTTGKRSPHRACRHVGFILHLPQGTGTASMHSLDLREGWAAVRLSAKVREHRRVSKRWMTPLDSPVDFTEATA